MFNSKPDIEKLRKEQKIDKLVKAISYKEDYNIRLDAIRALSGLKMKDIVEPLCKALEDNNSLVRSAAASTLGELKDERAVDSLIKIVDSGYDNMAAIRALGEIGSRKALACLRIHALKKEYSLGIERKAALEALMKIGDEDITDLLMTCLKDEQSLVRETAANILKNIGAPQDLTSQIWLELIDKNWPRIVSFKERAVDILHEALYIIRDIDDRKAIIEMLAAIGGKGSLTILSQAFKSKVFSSNYILKNQIFQALCRFKDKQTAEFILDALSNWNEYKKDAILEAVGLIEEMGDSRAIEPLCSLLRHSDGKVRLAAVSALAKIGDSSAIVPLKKLAETDDYREIVEIDTFDMIPKYGPYEVREAAHNALQQIKGKNTC